MALVAYSDSEASDSEPETTKAPQPTVPKPATAASSSAKAAPTIVDRSNPRKIRVALPEIKPESSAGQDGDYGPARKKPRIGGGGAFSGFNSFLPAPKRTPATADKEKKNAPARKVFSLKTGATPGFDRAADAEMRNDMALGMNADDGEDETIPKAGSLRTEEDSQPDTAATDEIVMKPEAEVKLKGNPMMFRPLSVARGTQKKKKAPPKTPPGPSETTAPVSQAPKSQAAPASNPAPAASVAPEPTPAPKAKKVSLFSLSSEDSTPADTTSSAPGQGSIYEPLVYTGTSDAQAAGPERDPQTVQAQSTGPAQTLSNIADDLNLSRAQRRHLFGRNADSSNSRILHFNTDTEYAANQEMAHEELAAQQHNPVRSIAPGKHSLQQLVNAASSQRDALEESFATGRRNKKEAGSKYGW